jgi:hypothetical protein
MAVLNIHGGNLGKNIPVLDSVIKLSINGYSDITDDMLYKLSNITDLRVEGLGCTITDSTLAGLPNLRRLMIGVWSSCITDLGISTLSKLSSLRLTGNRNITGRYLNRMPQLQTLIFSRSTTISDDILSELTALRTLGLKNSKTNTDMALVKLTNLTSLDVRNTKITESGITHLTNLTTVYIGTKLTGALRFLPNLSVLTMMRCGQDRCNCHDLSTLTNLTVLDAPDYLIYLDILRKMPKLTSFNYTLANLLKDGKFWSYLGTSSVKILSFPNCNRYPIPEPLHSSCDIVQHWGDKFRHQLM